MSTRSTTSGPNLTSASLALTAGLAMGLAYGAAIGFASGAAAWGLLTAARAASKRRHPASGRPPRADGEPSAEVLAPPPTPEPQAPMPAHPLEGRRILVADDGADNRRLIEIYLKRAGAQVELVENGQQAVDALLAADVPFDALLLDMCMPVMDGYGAASALREAGSNVPIVAVTALLMEADRLRCIAAGCDDCIGKPVNAADLETALGRQLHRPAKAA